MISSRGYESASLTLRVACTLFLGFSLSGVAPLVVAIDEPSRQAIDWHRFWAMVDSRWPRDDSTAGSTLKAFRAFETPNIIKLDDGVAFRVADLECSAEGAEMLARLLSGNDVKIAVSSPDLRVAAVGVEHLMRLDFGPLKRGVLNSPVVSRPFETAIINRWCWIVPGAKRHKGASDRSVFLEVAAECFATRDSRALGCNSLLSQFTRRDDSSGDK